MNKIIILVLIVFCILFYFRRIPNLTLISVSPFIDVKPPNLRNVITGHKVGEDVNPPTFDVITGKSYSIYIEGLRGLNDWERQEIFNKYIEEHGTGSYTFCW